MARPVIPLLSKERIVTAAITLLDSGGQFTIPALGKALGVHPSSLYNHFVNRDAIIEAMRAQFVESVDFGSVAGLPWDETFMKLARALRSSFADHPYLVPLLVGQQVSNSQAIEVYEMLSDRLSSAGFDDQDVMAIISVFDSYTTGAGLDATAPLETWVFTGRDSALSRALSTPELARERSASAFEFGLDLIVEGLRRKLASVTSGP